MGEIQKMMSKKFVQHVIAGALTVALTAGTVLGTLQPSYALTGVTDKVLEVGLYYSSSAKDGVNLQNRVGSGFQLGYYDSNDQFIPLTSTAETTISVVKTENVYYGSSGGYLSYHDNITSNVAVGCYHLELPGSYETYQEAWQKASLYADGFVAYIKGVYYARVGNYLNSTQATQAKNALGVDCTIKGTSVYGISVVPIGTNDIIFQYDDNGAGKGLGVVPIATQAGEKPITYFKGYTWYGGFRFERVGGGDLTCVNMVNIEDYTKGVLPYEMSANWPLEALKAQAVCARTYAMSNLNKHSKYGFDVCNTTDCQVYRGTGSSNSNSDTAVDQTAGQVATYNGAYASTVYYSSNGGATMAAKNVWGYDYPYLQGKLDPYEADVVDIIGTYNWTREVPIADLKTKLQARGYNCSNLVNVQVKTYTAEGNPLSIVFTDDRGKQYTLTAYGMVTLLGLRSYRYEIDCNGTSTVADEITINGVETTTDYDILYGINGSSSVSSLQNGAYVITDKGTEFYAPAEDEEGPVSTVVFKGTGFGHNVGMSQWGAYAMAKRGLTYMDILNFYYTGVTVG